MTEQQDSLIPPQMLVEWFGRAVIGIWVVDVARDSPELISVMTAIAVLAWGALPVLESIYNLSSVIVRDLNDE